MRIVVRVGSRKYSKSSGTLERIRISRRSEIDRKITHPFRELGVPHVNPALPLEEALEMMENM